MGIFDSGIWFKETSSV